MIKEKYTQLCLACQFGGIRTITIHIRYRQFNEQAALIKRCFIFEK